MSESSHHPQIALRTSGWWEFLCWGLGLRQRVVIEGESMLPLLEPGDEVLMSSRSPEPGQLVVAQHPFKSVLLIKLLDSCEQDRCWLLGLNPAESTDSRSLGNFSKQALLGVVTSKLPERV